MANSSLRAVDLFSGCGGMSLGFQNIGFDVVAAFDNWQPAAQVYKENFEHPIYDFDLAKQESKNLITQLKPDLIIGGPPCQDFSSAGKRDDTLGRADLTISYANIVTSVRPRFFVMENVERIKKSRILKQAVELLKAAGFGITMEILNASHCHVPQLRKRFFLIGGLNESDDFLLPYLERAQSKSAMTLYDYLGDSLGIEHYYRHPRSYKRRAIFSIHEPSPTIRGVNRPLPAGYPGHQGDTSKDLEKIRPLTTIERSYVQTFPESFKFSGTKTDLEQMIANAVPVRLGELVARCLSQYMEDKKQNRLRERLQPALF